MHMRSKAFIFSLLLFIKTPLLGQVLLPYQTGFDVTPTGWTAATVSGTAWELGTPTAAGTQGAYSAPNCWGTDLDSGYRANSLSYLNSPSFVLTNPGTPYLLFRQFRYMSAGLDGFHLELSVNGQGWLHLNAINPGDTVNWYNSTSLFSTGQPGFTGVSAGGWQSSSIRLPLLQAGDSLRIRFVFRSNGSFGSAQPGVFIDDFSLNGNVPATIDIRPIALVYPGSYLPSPQNAQIRVLVRNQSSMSVDSIRIAYSLDGSPFQNQTIVFGLAAGVQDTFAFGTVFFSNGPHTLKLVASKSGDINPGNDTILANVNVLSTLPVPYFNDFETDTSGWSTTASPFTAWEYGTPAYGQTTGAYSGLSCWDINLSSGYGSGANAILQSPAFDFSQSSNPYISFALNCVTEDSWDGVRLEYSTNNGSSWTLLGALGDPLAENWYTDNQLNSSNLPAWEGNLYPWLKPKYRVLFLAGNPSVRFRFVFTSDGSINSDGVSIDDFEIGELPPYDLSIDELVLNDFTYPTGSNSGQVRLLIRNNGTQTASGFSLGYKLNGVQVVNQFFPGSLPPFTSTVYILPGTTIQQGIQDFCGFVNWTPDTNQSNDLYCTTGAGIPTDTLTYFNNFDSGPDGWVQRSKSSSALPTQWELGTPQYGLTNSAYSMPAAWDINLGTPYSAPATSELYSPFFDLTGTLHPALSFWQNRNLYLSNRDGFRIDYRFNQDTTWNVLGSYFDTLGTNWYDISFLYGTQQPGWTGNSGGWINCTYPLDSISPGTGTIQFRFVFSSTLGGLDGVSIDDFTLSTVYEYDAALTATLSPQGVLLSGAQVPYTVRLTNKGSQPIISLNINYRINGGSINMTTWSGFLLPDSSTLVTLGQANVQTGSNSTIAWVSWPSDQFLFNDTTSSSFSGLPTNPLPYNEDFESGNGFWYNSFNTPSTVWEYGTPTLAPLNTAHSGSMCWDVNLNTPYGNLAFAALESPPFSIAGITEVFISFWINYRTESGMDGAFVQYSTDGVNWQLLGEINDTLATNWYTGSLYGGRIGWSGIGNGWTRSTYRFKPTPGTNAFRLRFIFLSDPSLVDAGFSLDDIQLVLSTGLQDELETGPDNLFVYPNPATGLVRIESGNSSEKLLTVKLVDAHGSDQPVRIAINSIPGFTLNVSRLESGVYWLIVQTTDGKLKRKPLVVVTEY